MIERPLPVPTLGERLDAQARLMVSRREPVFSWAPTFGVLAHRLTELSTPFEGRFDRVEATAGPRRPVPADQARVTARPAAPAPANPSASHAAGSVPTTAAEHEPAGDDLGAGRDLPADVRRRLRDVSGPGADLIRVHAGGRADAIARAHDADAVTTGPDVFFREGRLGYGDQHAMALLAHEASHVSDLLRPGFVPPAGNEALAGVSAGEARALDRERSMLSGAPRSRAAGGPSPAAHQARPAPATAGRGGPAMATAGASAPVHRAATDRDPGAAAGLEVDVDALRRGVVADLMLQLRTEFERGG